MVIAYRIAIHITTAYLIAHVLSSFFGMMGASESLEVPYFIRPSLKQWNNVIHFLCH